MQFIQLHDDTYIFSISVRQLHFQTKGLLYLKYHLYSVVYLQVNLYKFVFTAVQKDTHMQQGLLYLPRYIGINKECRGCGLIKLQLMVPDWLGNLHRNQEIQVLDLIHSG